jgi:aminoglycoside 6'-N-acetyltransferase I
MSDVLIRRATRADFPAWLRMRTLLWTEFALEQFEPEMNCILADQAQAAFLAVCPDGTLCGFLEASVREFAEGCETSPVGYIEGWYVDESLRGNGVGTLLMHAAEDWARSFGLTEMASDTWLDNLTSIQVHLKMGYEEIERLVHFAKQL